MTAGSAARRWPGTYLRNLASFGMVSPQTPCSSMTREMRRPLSVFASSSKSASRGVTGLLSTFRCGMSIKAEGKLALNAASRASAVSSLSPQKSTSDVLRVLPAGLVGSVLAKTTYSGVSYFARCPTQ